MPRRSTHRSRSRHCATSLVDEGVNMISKSDEVCHEYVVRKWVGNDWPHDGLVNLDNITSTATDSILSLTIDSQEITIILLT